MTDKVQEIMARDDALSVDVLTDLCALHDQTGGGVWARGMSSHETVLKREGKPDYHVAHFRHADYASFVDAAHKYMPLLIGEITDLRAENSRLREVVAPPVPEPENPLADQHRANYEWAHAGWDSCKQECDWLRDELAVLEELHWQLKQREATHTQPASEPVARSVTVGEAMGASKLLMRAVELHEKAEGWVMVPAEPTPAMLVAMWDHREAMRGQSENRIARAGYAAMLAATPSAPTAVEPDERATCEWTVEDDDNGTWQSSCGELWSFIEGGPKENRVSFCHHCGKPAVVRASKGTPL